jgi:hypothetical protein
VRSCTDFNVRMHILNLTFYISSNNSSFSLLSAWRVDRKKNSSYQCTWKREISLRFNVCISAPRCHEHNMFLYIFNAIAKKE